MKNTLGDLNNHLFEQLERLNDVNLRDDRLKEEISREKASMDYVKERCKVVCFAEDRLDGDFGEGD